VASTLVVFLADRILVEYLLDDGACEWIVDDQLHEPQNYCSKALDSLIHTSKIPKKVKEIVYLS
jgi:hypothetical protein